VDNRQPRRVSDGGLDFLIVGHRIDRRIAKCSGAAATGRKRVRQLTTASASDAMH